MCQVPGTPILEVKNISKRFPGTQALAGVSLAVSPGSIHAVVGENGAGKSTLMNVIAGVYQPDEGAILIDGAAARDRHPLRCAEAGRRVRPPGDRSLPAPHRGGEHLHEHDQRLQPAHHEHERVPPARGGAPLRLRGGHRPRQRVSELTISQQQVVEIAKALSMNCRLIILDEPTAALTETETGALFTIVHRPGENRASASCTSATACARCSRTATPSRSCATAS